MNAWRGAAVLIALALPGAAEAQGFLLRLDSRAQVAQYRGVTLDSVPVGDTVTGPTGGPTTGGGGYAVTCVSGLAYCSFFRPGPVLRGAPFTTTADLSLWGLGVTGLSFRASARLGAAVGDADAWPGTDPAMQLLEGYAQYARERFILQLGRQTVSTRFGLTGFDGGALTLRDATRGLELGAYGGWGLAQGTSLPVTSPALNPLDEFRPQERTLVAGGHAGWSSTHVDARVEYLREVDPSVDYFVSERAGMDMAIRPHRGWQLSGGAEYDLAAGWWGSANAELDYVPVGGRITASLATRRYRPHFDLWTIWGAFSPVPYHAVDGQVSLGLVHGLRLRASGERYSFDAADVSTPLVDYETSGWRFSWGATYRFHERWTLDGGYRSESGPGAASRGFEGALTYTLRDILSLGIQAATLDRPLEFRFDDASVDLYGVTAEYHASSRLRLQLDASRYLETRARPDAAAFDWNQVRVSGRIVLLLGGGAGSGLGNLPPAVRRMPGGREER